MNAFIREEDMKAARKWMRDNLRNSPEVERRIQEEFDRVFPPPIEPTPAQ
jgi:hypothetical protein